jgi:hypothetical protein
MMARPTKEQREQSVLERARCEFERVQETMQGERRQCIEDRRFVSIPGAMWENGFGQQFENKPRLEINKAMLSLIRIYNEYRNNRITVDFVSRDGVESELADICDDLYRADEQDSCADEAYDNAFDEATSGGFGAWRLRAQYEDEEDDENEYQRIRLEPIYDADTSVYFDLDAKRQDKSDARRAWIISSVSRPDYEEEYGDDPATWPKDVNTQWFDWYTPDVVYIAEYYELEEVRETVRIFQPVEGEEVRLVDPEEDEVAELVMLGAVEVRQKRVKRKRVHKWLLSGGRVLEDYGIIAGKNIPVVPVYGKRWFIDNVERCMGHVRLVKDPIRVLNMMTSKLAEISAASGIEKPIFTPEMVAGLESYWAEDPVSNYPYMLVNPITDANGQEMPGGPIGYTKAPEVPVALAALMQLLQADLNELLGNQQAGEKIEPNLSGKAVELIQQRLDMQAFIYMSNFAKAMRRCGEIWLSMAKEIYADDGRKMKGIGMMGELSSVELGAPIIKDGKLSKRANLGEADFDVTVDVGPSFSSSRQATVRGLTGLLQMTNDPQDQKILSSLAMMNMEGEGLSDVREYKRKELVAMGVLEPNEEELAAMAEAQGQEQPSAQDQYLMSETVKNAAETAEHKATTRLKEEQARKTAAETERTEAQTIQIAFDTARGGQ